MTEPTDDELTAIYKAANGEDTGKAQPLTTQRIFRAMRAAIAKWGTPPAVAGEPVFAFRRKGLDDFCTCTEERYAELSAKPNLFETCIFYTAPQPTQAQAGAVPLTCEWTHNADDSFWDTECGQSWRFDDGGPKENHMNFCHCCGKTLRIKGGQHGAE